MNTLIIRNLGVRDYKQVLTDMQRFTESRNESTMDELWIVEHSPVFTQGQAGKQEHLLDPGRIPVVKTDRGGQVTYHGPGQLVFYCLFDLKRINLGIRQFVELIQNTIISLLADYGINAYTQESAPGVYVDQKKIASLGLRIKKGCSYHGLSLNVDMDLKPFEQINPCGYPGLEVTQLSALGIKPDVSLIINDFIRHLTTRLNYDKIETAGYSANN